MRLKKVTQTYLGIVSVFLLTLIGTGGYLYSNGSFSSSADEITYPIPSYPEIAIIAPEKVNVGEEFVVQFFVDTAQAELTEVILPVEYTSEYATLVSYVVAKGAEDEAVISEDQGKISITLKPTSTRVGTSSELITVKFKVDSGGIFSISTASYPNDSIQITTNNGTYLPESVSAQVNIE